MSEQDQAELDAQAEFEEAGGGATLIDGPAADDPPADGRALPIWLIVVLIVAGAVLVIELVRGRSTAAG